MTSQISTRFGIELETDINSKQDQWEWYDKDTSLYDLRWQENVQTLAEALTSAGIPTESDVLDQKLEGPKRHWKITQDGSIESQDTGRCPAELVSPVLDYDNRGQWTKELRSIFNVIAKAPFSALPTEFCATQVHVSLVPDWTVSQIRSLAQAVLYYSEPFERLAERLKRSDKALVKPNRVAWGKATITEALQILDEASRAWDIVRLMNPRGPGVRLDRYCHWSFWPLVGLVVLKDRGVATTGDDGSADAYDDEARETMHKKLGTVEFRLPPGSRTVEEAIMWVDLANLFVRAAVQRTVP